MKLSLLHALGITLLLCQNTLFADNEKKEDVKQDDSTVVLNGVFESTDSEEVTALTEQFGFVDDGGLFWYDERSTFDSDGVVVVRQTLEYDDEAEIMHSKVVHIDPVDGEVVKTYEVDLPYAPSGHDDDFDDFDDSDEGEEETGDTEQE